MITSKTAGGSPNLLGSAFHEEHLKALRDTEKTMKKTRKATRKELSEKPEE